MLLCTATPAATVLAGLGFRPLWASSPLLALTMTVLFSALFAIGVVLLAEPGQAGAGAAMIVSALLLVLSWVNEWGGGPFPLLSQVPGQLWILLAGWALYRYPDRSLTPRDRIVFEVMFGWFVVAPWLTILSSRPEWHAFPADSWWPTVIADPAFYNFLTRSVDISIICVAAFYIALWVKKMRRARPVERKLKRANSIAAIVATAFAASVPFAHSLNAPDSTVNVLLFVAGAAILAVPLAFLAAVLRRHIARSSLTVLLPQLHGNPTKQDIDNALRVALGDPELEVLPWSEALGHYVDESQEAVDHRRLSDRLVTAVATPDGRRLALVVTDRALNIDPELVEAAVAAVSLSLQNTLLVDTVQRQLSELQQASKRIVKAGDQERRRLEHDLHDGAQQHFLALGLMIGAAEELTSDMVTREMLTKTRTQLEHALAELRRLAHGLHPGSLRLGLAPAIRQECGRYSTPMTVQLPEQSLPQTTEVTAYYAICEAVANAVKHSDAGRIDINGSVDADTLIVVVEDDGRGGARVGAGKGLTGIIDRVRALGGSTDIWSPPSGGTRVTVRIPCV